MAASPRVDLFAVPTLASDPGQIVAGPDGDLWFLESRFPGTSRIGRADPLGRVVEFPLPTPAGGAFPELTSLTAGPDGAIWAGRLEQRPGRPDRP